MRHLRSLLVLLGVAALSAYFMASAYSRASRDAIQQLYAQERILAEQAAKGIASYFAYQRQALDFLGRDADVVANTERGQRLLRELFRSQRENLLSLTRMGADGRILYTYPEEQAAGRSILEQPHVRTLIDTTRPVVSQVFTSVQGFECVALHVPVFDEGRFAGSLAALIPFDQISKRYLDGVRLGRSGHAVLLSSEGIELYCPVPGHVRRSIFETSRDYPGSVDMAGRMLRGESGAAVYEYPSLGPGNGRLVQKHAYFQRIPLENTFWSISVTAPVDEALVFIQGFRDRWTVAVSVLLVAFVAWAVSLARAYQRLSREQARALAQERVLAAERERERALSASEELFRTYFEESQTAMAITSPDKRWLVVNDRLTQMLGYSREELLALDWTQVTHADDVAIDVARFDRMIAGELQGYSIEKRFVRKDGEPVYAIVSVRLVRKPDGTPDHCLAQAQDITERKRMDEERARLGEQLRQSQKLEAIGRLAGGVAHDYNNLLTVQFGHLAMLKEDPDLAPALRAPLGEIEKSARMAAQLTRQLLAFGRRQVLQLQRLDLNESVLSVIDLMRRVLPDDIALDVRTAPTPLWVDADPGTVEQVVMNLVVNARDAMSGGGRLTVTTDAVRHDDATPPSAAESRPGDFVRLTVTDTGRGMDAETRRRIFEPFFTTKDAGKGTGLGLSTVYGIVRQHEGWIDVESAVGEGATFRVHYPAAPPPERRVRPASEAASSIEGDGETVLLAEDNDAVRAMLTRTLERLNYRVLAAANADQAFGLWQREADQVALLLSDMVMTEGGSGLDLARRLRQQKPRLPVIIMSGYSQELVEAALDADMTFLPKPWTRDTLAGAVRARLREQVAGDRGP